MESGSTPRDERFAAEKTTDLSGRGVGLDVVRTNLKKLNGSVEIDSQIGRGTTVKRRLPLTLAILPVLLVQVEKEVYALPLRSVVETAQVDPKHVHVVEGSEVWWLRGEPLALLRLDELFPAPPNSAAKRADHSGEKNGVRGAKKVVIPGVAERRIALQVDRLPGQESTVMKPLGAYLQGCSCVAGATIGGDGHVRLVLDPAGLLANLESTASAARRATA